MGFDLFLGWVWVISNRKFRIVNQVISLVKNRERQGAKRIALSISGRGQPQLRVLGSQIICTIAASNLKMQVAADGHAGPANFADLITQENILPRFYFDFGKMGVQRKQP